MKAELDWLENATNNGCIDFKRLERFRGFAIHVSRTYTQMIPYLKGIHQTLDCWRPWRGTDGWQLAQREIELMREVGASVEDWESTPPEMVPPVKRLAQDVKALKVITQSAIPPPQVKFLTSTAGIIYAGGMHQDKVLVLWRNQVLLVEG